MVFSNQVVARSIGFFLVIIVIAMLSIFVPALSGELRWFQYANGLIGVVFLTSLYIKLKASLSKERSSPMGKITVTFFLKLLAMMLLLFCVFTMGGREVLREVRYAILGLFLFYTLMEFIFLQIKR